ncbi:hypothetical protein [Pseudopedobacter beijingensis]|uniref:Uncharacterized protein n=1 Tax=Pseudopedobacter beijingensis TaxID=1207056 RepID=A0ABW4IFC2_9SPHI
MNISRLLPIFILFLSSCKSGDKTPGQHELSYFNIKGYFEKEADKLSNLNPTVHKNISYNKQVEEKEVKIEDWHQEFALFIDSDINKSSWRRSYRKDSTSYKTTYTALEDKLRTRKIEISFDTENRPLHFKIENNVSNYLYDSHEVLEYIPDSLYRINKFQKVVVLGQNDYAITGNIK